MSNYFDPANKIEKLFTTNYKKYYPSFKEYINKKENGGIIDKNTLDLSKLSSEEKDTLLQLLLQSFWLL